MTDTRQTDQDTFQLDFQALLEDIADLALKSRDGGLELGEAVTGYSQDLAATIIERIKYKDNHNDR